MDIASLSYRVDSSDLGKATTELDRKTAAAKRAETASGRLMRAWQGMIRPLRGYIAVQALVNTALASVTTLAARSINELSMMSQQIGVSTEALSEMRYAAEQMANVSAGQFDMSLRRMTRRIEEAAAGGGPAADALRRMGLSARELARLAPDEQFRRFADAIKDTSSQGDRLRNVMALMDTEGVPLVAMLQQGADAIRDYEAEAARLGLTIDHNTAQAAAGFMRQLSRLNGTKKGLSIMIASEMMPVMSRLTERFVSSAQGAQSLGRLARFAGSGLKVVATIGSFVVGVFKTVGEALGGVAAAIVALFTGNFRDAWNITKDFSSDIVGNVKQTAADIANIWDDIVVWDGHIIDGKPKGDGLNKVISDAGATADALRELEEAQAKAREGFVSMSMALAGPVAEASYRYAVELQRLRDLAEEGGVAATALAEAEANLARQHEANMEAIERRLNPVGELIRSMEAELALMKMSHADRELAIRLRHLDADATDKQVSALRRLIQEQEEQRDLIAQLDAVRYAGSELMTEWTTGAKSFGDALEDSLKRLHRQLTQIAMDRMIQQLLGGFGTSDTGSLGGWLAGLFGGGRRHGGPVRRDRMYEVNEGGIPELLDTPQGRYLLPGSHGNVTPLAQAAPARGGSSAPMQVIVNNNAPVRVEAREERMPMGDGNELRRLVINVVSDDLANGGQLAKAGKSRFGWKETV